MAKKSIGAYITLDGEKQFKQDVTSCNKSLSALKSEMSLVAAESEGQANSLDSLRKKHEVLNKILDAQKRKEEEIQKGLDHARQSYEKVGTGVEKLSKSHEEQRKKVEDLQEEYKSACDRLEKMEKAGNSSEHSIQKQKAVVESLSQELQKENETLRDMSAELSKGEKNYQTAGNRIKDWETKLNTAQAQTVKATKALNENASYMREAEHSTDQCAKSIDEYGKKVQEATSVTMEFGEVLKQRVYNAAIDLAKNGTQKVTESIFSMESAQRQFQASTGITTQEMKEYKTVMEELHNGNYGEDIGDIASSMALVRQYTNELQPQKIKAMTENGIVMRDVFGMELSETIRGVDAIIDEMGTSSQMAFDLMAKGAQNGLNKSGELADNIAEYGSLWAQAGFSAQEMFTIMQNGLDSGAYNLDKVNDFVKEFGISLTDGRIEASLGEFSKETQHLFRNWQDGKATTKDVFYSVINDLNKATNKQKVLTIASNTWSSLGEDNALKVITSLGKVNNAYDNVRGTMEDIKEIKYDTLQSRFEQLGKKAISEFAEPLAKDALPVIEKGLDVVIDNMDILISLIKVGATGLATYKAVSTAMAAYKTVTEAAAASQGILNAVMNENPAVLLATAVAGVGTALVFMKEKMEETKSETNLMIESSEKLNEEINSISQDMRNTKKDWEETAASIDIQKGAAEKLTDELFLLQEQEGKNENQKRRMKTIVNELNQIYPELTLEIDKETGSLNKNKDAVEKSIEAGMAFSKAKAAEEKLTEISKELADAEMKVYEAEDKKSEITEKLEKIEDERARVIKETNEGMVKYNGAIQDSSRVLIELQGEEDQIRQKYAETEESIKNLQKNYDDLSLTYESVEGYMQTQVDKGEEVKETHIEMGEAAEAGAKVAQRAAEETTWKIADTYTGMQQTLSEVLSNQMNMFEEFDAGTEISTDKLLSNMKSQIDGVENWADNLAKLADRGINQNLLTYLSEMGPEGAAYVAAFAKMSDDELKKANDMWSESIDMKSGVEESVQGMLESYTTALNGGKAAIEKKMAEVGAGTVEGLVKEINARRPEAETAGESLGEKTTDSVAKGAQTHSPSRKTLKTGKDVVEGLTLGIKQSANQAESAASTLSKDILKKIDTELKPSSFQKTGKNVTNGLSQGVRSGKETVTGAVNIVTTALSVKVAADIQTNKYVTPGKRIPMGIASGIIAEKETALSAADSLATGVHNKAAKIESLYQIGLNLSKGMASGILAGKSYVINATANICEAAVKKARSDLKINSPSKVFEEIGMDMAEGQGKGYKKGSEELNKMIGDSVELPNIRPNGRAMTEVREFGGENYINAMREMQYVIKDAIQKGMREVILKVELDGRDIDRGLKRRGVMFT